MKTVKCAIYVRKSTEKGLEQEFNSLHNQEESCKAYIASQAFNNWEHYKTYEDGGISGGSMNRPSLQKMLNDIEKGNINVVIVYKLDRLSRSILDFHKMMITFENQDCNFVSITQSFDTSTSMGKLTLNMLLSFAQFEREISSERVRDKVYASKRKGLWTGGTPKLGYDVIDKKLVINNEEAKNVRFIFQEYIKCESSRKLEQILVEHNIRNKKWLTLDNKIKGGKKLYKSTISRILKDKIYIGRITSLRDKDDWRGEHKSIIDEETWDKVHNTIERKRQNYTSEKILTGYMLSDLLQLNNREYFRKDKSKKEGRIYRYYVRDNIRLPAGKIDGICSDILEQISICTEPHDVFDKIVFFENKLIFHINKDNEYLDSIYYEKFKDSEKYKSRTSINGEQILIEANLIQGYKNSGQNFMTEKEVNVSIVKALAYGWRYRKMIQEEIPIYRIEEIEKIGNRKLYKYLNLTYLSPKIIDKLMNGKITISLADLCNTSSKYKDFSEQERALL